MNFTPFFTAAAMPTAAPVARFVAAAAAAAARAAAFSRQVIFGAFAIFYYSKIF
jgi:hypothetical protein